MDVEYYSKPASRLKEVESVDEKERDEEDEDEERRGLAELKLGD